MEVGTGINHVAKLTLWNIHPKVQDNVDEFKNKLKRKTEMLGAEFIEYDKEVGKWIMRIKHI